MFDHLLFYKNVKIRATNGNICRILFVRLVSYYKRNSEKISCTALCPVEQYLKYRRQQNVLSASQNGVFQ